MYAAQLMEYTSKYFQLLDRCLEYVDAELYSYLRSKKLSAEIYAFPCVSWTFTLIMIILKCAYSCFDTLRLYTTIRSSSSALGFPFSIWGTPQCSMCNRTTVAYEG